MPLFFVPIDVVSVPETGKAWANMWWVVNPDKGVAFYASNTSEYNQMVNPQCNADERVVRSMIARHYPEYVAQFIPVVFEAHAVREWRSIKNQEKIFNKLSED